MGRYARNARGKYNITGSGGGVGWQGNLVGHNGMCGVGTGVGGGPKIMVSKWHLGE